VPTPLRKERHAPATNRSAETTLKGAGRRVPGRGGARHPPSGIAWTAGRRSRRHRRRHSAEDHGDLIPHAGAGSVLVALVLVTVEDLLEDLVGDHPGGDPGDPGRGHRAPARPAGPPVVPVRRMAVLGVAVLRLTVLGMTVGSVPVRGVALLEGGGVALRHGLHPAGDLRGPVELLGLLVA